MTSPWRDAIAEHHVNLRAHGLRRERSIVSTVQGVESIINNRDLVNFSSNDYLGLAHNASLIQKSKQALAAYGVGSGASHLVCGHHALHHQLELELAGFVGAERALLFSSGYAANLAIAQAFCDKRDLLLMDKLNHASLIDSAKLSAATFKRFAHADLDHAAKILQKASFNRCLIASDGVFSMDGDIAPIEKLVALSKDNRGLLFIDDAHGFGVLGSCGQGTLNDSGFSPTGELLMMATLGKAFGGYGAFIAGDEIFIEHLIQTARSYIYTTALPPMLAASAIEALRIVRDGSRRSKLAQNIQHFKHAARELNIPIMPSSTAIQPILVGSNESASGLSNALYNHGYYVSAIRPPTVPKNTARLRVTLSSSHSCDQIDALLSCISEHAKMFDLKLNGSCNG